MTYNVFGGTLNLALSIQAFQEGNKFLLFSAIARAQLMKRRQNCRSKSTESKTFGFK